MDPTTPAPITNPVGSFATPAPGGIATPPTPPPPGQRKLGAGHVVAIIGGFLLLIPGLGMFGGGALALTGQAIATDDDGYFEFTLDRLAADGVAIATADLRFDGDAEATDWLLDWLDVDVRLQVDGARSTGDVFVGIARSDDVDRYLTGSAYSELVEVDGRTPVYLTMSGDRRIETPLTQQFWTVSESGPGMQELTWEARPGRWSVVVMNADGSPDVAADVEVGAKTGALTPIAVTLLVMGGLLVAVSVGLIVGGARGRRVPETPGTAGLAPSGPHGDGSPLDPSSADAAAHDEARTPVGA